MVDQFASKLVRMAQTLCQWLSIPRESILLLVSKYILQLIYIKFLIHNFIFKFCQKIGTFDGAIKLFSPFTGKLQCLLNPPAPSGTDPLPVSRVSWRPQWAGQTLRDSTVLCSTTADGAIQHWSLTTMK